MKINTIGLALGVANPGLLPLAVMPSPLDVMNTRLPSLGAAYMHEKTIEPVWEKAPSWAMWAWPNSIGTWQWSVNKPKWRGLLGFWEVDGATAINLDVLTCGGGQKKYLRQRPE